MPRGFQRISTQAGEGEKFVHYGVGGKNSCDEVVSFAEHSPDGKGNKTLVSARSGYAVELVGVVDRETTRLRAKESELTKNLAVFLR